LRFDRRYHQIFPVFGPLAVMIDGRFTANLDFAFGYDTQGLFDFADSGWRNPELLFNGFYAEDLKDAQGNDRPEVRLDASLVAGAVVAAGITAGVAGGVYINVNADLHDPDGDGKVRLGEIAANFLNEAKFGSPLLAPLAVFDVNGKATARLFAFVDAGIRLSADIVKPVTLLDFDVPFTRKPMLAKELAGGVLQLNIGKFAEDRLEGDTSDLAEEIFVAQQGSGFVKVWSPTFGIDEARAQVYRASTRILALGGEGDDVIDLSRVSDAGIRFEIEGGAGDDLIRLGAGPGTVRGGAGDDRIHGSDSADLLWGDAGADWIDGRGGNDLIFGDAGRISDDGLVISVTTAGLDRGDVLIGGAGSDLVFGGGGADRIGGDGDPADVAFASTGNDWLIGDGSIVTLGAPGSFSSIVSVEGIDRGAGGDDVLAGQGGNDRLWGGRGNDTLHGGAGDDRISGGSGNDVADGSAGDDVIAGDAGDDTLTGGDGDDTVDGGEGQDLIRGGTGRDTLRGGAGADRVFGEQDDDVLEGGDGEDALFGGGGADVVRGGGGNDILYGDDADGENTGPAGDDVLVGGTGDQVFHGQGGNDRIDTGDGNDVVYGGGGRDTITTGAGNHRIHGDGLRIANVFSVSVDGNNDVITVGPGSSRVFGELGQDTITLADGDHFVLGGAGDDVIVAGVGRSVIRGNAGADRISAAGGDNVLVGDGDETAGTLDEERARVRNGDDNATDDGADHIVGGAGNDLILGHGGDDRLLGGAGDDEIHGGDGVDVLQGGEGRDHLLGGAGDDVLHGNAGDDRLEGGAGRDLLFGGAGGDILHGHGVDDSGDDDAVDTLYGDFGAGHLLGETATAGNDGADFLYGQGGDDILRGEEGPDTIEGGRGADDIDGGAGDDRLFGGVGDDRILGNTGNDHVEAGDGADHVEGGDGDDTLFGDAGNDTILGNAGNDHADGGIGDDLIEGGDGRDHLLGGVGDDRIFGNAGDDLVEAGEGADHVEGGDGDDTLHGNEGDDRLFGNAGDDLVLAGDGADHVEGGDGDDRLYGEAGDDRILGNAGNDLALGGSGNDVIEGGDGEDNLYGGAGNDTVDGGAGDDLMQGDEGDDVLFGRAGNDRGAGGAGNDTIHGDDGDDHLLGDEGDDVLFGDTGFDRLEGGAGADTLWGGAEDDVLFAGTGLGKRLFGEDGDDLIIGSDDGADDPDFSDAVFFGDRIEGGRGNDRIFGLGGADRIDAGEGDDHVSGGMHGDLILAGAGRDTVSGGAGDDVIHGGDDSDTIDGGAGADRIFGEGGDDRLSAGTGTGDHVDGGAGDDEIDGSDEGDDVLVGGAGGDRLRGHAGNDRLLGGTGDDILEGGDGDDVLEGDTGIDVLIGGARHDTLYGHLAGGVGDDGAVDYLYGDFGTGLDEARAGNDRLFGQGGNDLLFGEGGDDLIEAAGNGMAVAEAGGGLGNVVDFGSGEGASASAFVVPAPTASPVPGPAIADADAGYSGPVGADVPGPWGELGGSASGLGLSASGHATQPSVAVDASGRAHVAWVDARNGNLEIYVLRHDGTTWHPLGTSASGGGVSVSATASTRPVVAFDASGAPTVAWVEVDGGRGSARMARFDAGTGAWRSVDTAALAGAGSVREVHLVATGASQVLVWLEDAPAGAILRASRWNGSAWSAVGTGVVASTPEMGGFAVAADGARVAVAWSQGGSGATRVHASEFDGVQWVTRGTAAGSSAMVEAAGESALPAIAYLQGTLFLGWRHLEDGLQSLQLRRFEAGVWTDAGSLPASPAAQVRELRLTAAGDALRVFWVDEDTRRAGQPLALYGRVWNGSAFVEALPGDASGAGLSDTGAHYAGLAAAIGADGRAYVAWSGSGTGPGADAASNVFLRVDATRTDRVFRAADSAALATLLATEDFGPDDVILLAAGTYAGFTIDAGDAGVTLIGAAGFASRVTGPVVVQGANVALVGLDVQGTVTSAADALTLRRSRADGLVLNGGADVVVVDNRFGAGGVRVASASAGVIARNMLTGTFDIAAAFGGEIFRNEIRGAAVGVRYGAAATLWDNRIVGNAVGVIASVDSAATGFGFVGAASARGNEIVGNDVGVQLAGRMQHQTVRGSRIGVTGTGTLGGDSLDAANRIEDNATGIANFNGSIQYNRIARNGIGVAATNGQVLHHNLLYRNTTAAIDVAAVSRVGIYQNTLYAPIGDNVRVRSGAREVEVIGNILWAEAGYDLFVANDAQAGFFSDHNVLYASGTGKVGHWTKDFVDVLDWQADIARFDLHSIGATRVNPEWARPRFADLGADDYRVAAPVAGLRFTSPSIDAADVRLDRGAASPTANLLTNPGFENGVTGWTVNPGSGAATGIAWDGTARFRAGNVEGGFAQQTVNLLAAGHTASQIDAGTLDAVFGGRLRRADDGSRDAGTVLVRFLDGAGNVIAESVADGTTPADRWSLAGGRAAIPVGTRSVVFRFEAQRVAGDSVNDAWLDGAFLRVTSESWAPDAGAYGFGAHEATPETARRIALRFPDLYTDWERGEPLAIRWETVGNTSFSSVRIDLLRDTADGPALFRTIAASTPDDGEFVWIPEVSGVDFGTRGLRIQVSLADAPEVLDRSQETFAVPEDGIAFWVDDGSDVGDEFTIGATGSNRNTGKSAASPKPNPTNLLRAYTLGADAVLRIDTGDYPLIDALTISGTVDRGLGLDEGFTITGPTDRARIARLLPAIPGTQFPGLIELQDADFVAIRHLTLADSGRGLFVHSGSESFSASDVTAIGHRLEGMSIATTAPFSDFARLSASDNDRWGIDIRGAIRSLTDARVTDNENGLQIMGPVERVTGNEVSRNNRQGMQLSQLGSAVIRRNVVSGNQWGVSLSGSGGTVVFGDDDLAAGNGNRVSDNRANGLDVSGNVLVAGNVFSANAGVGVASSGATVRANLASGNGTGVTASGGVVDRNRVYANGVVGIDSVSALLTGNVVYSSPIGIRLSSSASQARGNLVYGTSVRAMSVSATGSEVSGNTIHAPTGDALVVGGATGVAVTNNILVTGAGTALSVASDGFSGFRSDYNLFQVLAGGAVGAWQGQSRTTLASWQSATSGDANSLVADPLFVDPDGADGVLGFADAVRDGRDDDFHLRSAFGTFAGGSLVPVRDAITGLPKAVPAVTPVVFAESSPAIDRGRPGDAFALEPQPNGGFRNLGAYGNTAQASLSPERYVTLFSPNGGERVAQARDVDVRWRAAGFAGTVDIAYRGPSTGGAFVPLASGEANDGSYTWRVSEAGFPVGQYTLRVSASSDASLFDTSDTSFDVIAPIAFYYVNDGATAGDVFTTTAGAIGNDGLSPDRPMASLADLIARYDLGPGDTVLVDAGTYAISTNLVLTAQDSGVRIVGAGRELTILDRGNRSNGSVVLQMAGADEVRVESLSLTGGYHGVLASSGADSDAVVLSDVRVHGNAQAGVRIDASNDGWVLVGSRFEANDSDGVNGNGFGLRVEGNVFGNNRGYGLNLGNAPGAVVRGNEVTGNQTYGLYVNANLGGNEANRAVVEDNAASGNRIDGLYLSGDAVTGRNNRAWGNGAAGVYVSGGALVQGNEVWDNGTGINTSGATARGNVAWGNRGAGIDTSASLVESNRSYGNTGAGIRGSGGVIRGNAVWDNEGEAGILVTGSGPTRLENNTVLAPVGEAVWVRGGGVDVRNNILWVDSGHALRVDAQFQTGFVSDYNLFRLGANGKVAYWEDRSFLTRTDWVYGVGQDRNSVTGDPQFVDIDGADEQRGVVGGVDRGRDDDFRLRAGSIAIDRGDPSTLALGEPLPNGNRVDLGAYGNTAQATASVEPQIQVLGPNGLEKLEVGQTAVIAWRTAGVLPADTLLRVDSGDPRTAIAGWRTDTLRTNSSWSSTGTAVNTAGVANAAPAELYQSFATATGNAGSGASFVAGSLRHVLAAADGQYRLRLHFAEPSVAVGQRLFDVEVNGQRVDQNVDIRARAGGLNRAYVAEYDVSVSGGAGLELRLVNRSTNGNVAILGGWELMRLNAQAPEAVSVELQVSEDDGASWRAIASGLGLDALGGGRHAWTVDAQPTAGNTARVRAVLTGVMAGTGASVRVSDASDEGFQIANGGTAYYVNDGSLAGDVHTSAVGNNANSGKSADAPMASLAALLAAYDLDAGDVVYVDTGTYDLATNLVLTAEDSGVRIVGAGRELTILDRGNRSNGSVVLQMAGADEVRVESLSLTGGYHGVLASSGADSDAVVLSDVRVHGNAQAGVRIDASNDGWVLVGSRFEANDSDGVNGNGFGLRVEGNVFANNRGYGLNLGNAPGAVVRGNEVTGNQTYGLYVNANLGGNEANRAVVEDNAASGNRIDGLYLSGDAVTGRNNRAWGNGAAGVYVSGGALVQGNEVWDNGTGINTSGATARGNVAWGNRGAGIDTSASLVESNRSYGNTGAGIRGSGGVIRGNAVWDNEGEAGILVTGSGPTRLENNTVLAPVGEAVWVRGGGVDVRNNILWVDSGHALRVDAQFQTGFVSDYNLFRLGANGKVAYWEDRSFLTRTDWVYGVGQDRNSVTGDPQFVDIDGADEQRGVVGGVDRGRDDDFRLRAGSIAIDRGDPSTLALGEPLPNGNRVDLGAYGNTAQATASVEPQIQVLGPNGLEKLEVGQTAVIAWRTAGVLPADTLLRVDSGDPRTAIAGWRTDTLRTNSSWSSTGTAVNTAGVANAAPAELYQSFATATGNAGSGASFVAGSLRHVLAAADGQYRLRLHFAEPSVAVGQRLFDVEVNGQRVDQNVDIRARAGGLNRAYVAEYDVSVSGGAGLELRLVNRSTNGNVAILGGWELMRLNAQAPEAVSVELQVSEDDGASWRAIASGLGLDALGGGRHAWTVDAQPTAGNTARVRAVLTGVMAGTGASVRVSDASDEGFQIANGGTAYYVNDGSLAGDVHTSAVGNNANSGKSADAPMASLAALLAAYDLDAGDVVYVDTGTYDLATNLVLTAEDSGVRIVGAGMGVTVLDRGNTTNGSRVFDFRDADGVTVEAMTLRGAFDGVGASTGQDADNITLRAVEVVGHANTGVNVQFGNDGWVIEGSRIHANASRGVDFVQVAGRIEGSEIFANLSTGIVVRGLTTAAIVVADNIVRDNGSYGIDANTNVEVRGNRVFNHRSGPGNGIYLSAASAIANDVFDNRLGIYVSGGGLARGNEVHSNTVAGIEISSGTASGNRIHSNPIGIDGIAAGRIENNVIYGNTNFGILEDSSSTPATIVNNTIYQPVGDAIRLISSSVSAHTIANNILAVGAGAGIHVQGSVAAGFSSNFNLFDRMAGTAAVGVWGGAVRTDLAGWRSANGHDVRSTTGSADFLDIDGADNVLGDGPGARDTGRDDNFGLRRQSPAIDGANAYLSPMLDVEGRPRRQDAGTVDTGEGWPLYVPATAGVSDAAPRAGETSLNLRSSNTWTEQSLGFGFTLYGQTYTRVAVNTNGYLHFAGPDGQSSDANDPAVFLRNVRIAPLWDNLTTAVTGGDVFVDRSVPGQIRFRWAAQVEGAMPAVAANFAVTLFADGTFRFDYGAGNTGLTPTVGVSGGNGLAFVLAPAYDGVADLGGAQALVWAPRPDVTYYDIGAYEFQGDSRDGVAPTVVRVENLPASGGTTAAAFTSLRVAFSESLDGVSARGAANYTLLSAGVDDTFQTPDDLRVALRPLYSFPETGLTLQLVDGVLPDGRYRLTLSGTAPRGIFDTAGNALDGEGDGTPGGDYVHEFRIDRRSNIAPVAVSVTESVVEDGSVTFTLGASDANGDALTFSLVSATTRGVLTAFDPVTGQVTYRPDADFNGTDTFRFRADDGRLGVAEGTITLRVAPVNDAPTGGTLALTTSEDVPLTVVLPGADRETSRANLLFELVTAPVHGRVTQAPGGSWLYTPDADFVGDDAFTYRVRDRGDPDGSGSGALASEPGTVSLRVTARNDAPRFGDFGTLTVNEGGTLAFLLPATDPEGDALTYGIVGEADGASVNPTTGRFAWRAVDGPATRRFIVSAADGQQTTQAEFTVTVRDVAPRIDVTGPASVNVGERYEITFSATDPGTDTVSGWRVNWGDGRVTELPGNGRGASTTFATSGDVAIVVTAVDEDGEHPSAPLPVAVIRPNVAPQAFANTIATDEDSAIAFDLIGFDADGDALTYEIVTAPLHGVVEALSADGRRLSYRPAADYNGADALVFRAFDGVAWSASATVSFDVAAVNDIWLDTWTDEVEEGGAATYVFRREGDLSRVNSISFELAPGSGTAASGGDVAGGFGTATIRFDAGVDTATVTRAIVDDALREPDEAFHLRVQSVTGGTFRGNAVARTVILASDVPPPAEVRLASATLGSVAEGTTADPSDPSQPGRGGQFSLRIERGPGDLSEAAAVWFTLGGSIALSDLNDVEGAGAVDERLLAQNGIDAALLPPDRVGVYLATIGAGQSSATVTITVAADATDEPDETLRADLIGVSSGGVLTSNAAMRTATGTVLDDDEPPTFRVVSASPTTSGVSVRFDREIDPSELNLYGNTPADITLVGATTGAVRGSLVLDADGRGVSFIRTGGPLAADAYTLRLRAGAGGFTDLAGNALDGNRDNIGGDDYVGGFTVAPATGSILASIADFMRGPGQAVVVPNSAAATVSLPIRLSNGNGVRRFETDVLFDARLLTVQDVRLPAGIAGTLTRTAIAGGLRIEVVLAAPLGAGAVNLVDLVARVPDSAPYGAQQAIELRNLRIEDAAGAVLGSRGEVAVHTVGHFGDGTGDGTYARADVDSLQRIVTGADNGFAAWRNTDAVIVGDINASGSLTSLDASRLLVHVSGSPRPEIPAVPVVRPPAPALPPAPARSDAPAPMLVAMAASGPAANAGNVDWSARLPDAPLPSASAPQTASTPSADSAWKSTTWAKDLGVRLKQADGGSSLKALLGQLGSRNGKR
jgi:Ca2+-binding RTX toxin-like protein